MSLENVKVGDAIAVLSHYGRFLEKSMVTRVTQTQVVTENGGRFLKRGIMVGGVGGYNVPFAVPWDEDAHGARLAEQRRAAWQGRLEYRIAKREGLTLTNDQLDRIEAILDEGKEPAP